MKFFPNHFVDFLINQVGFTGGDVLAVPEHSALGFRRPIHVSNPQELLLILVAIHQII